MQISIQSKRVFCGILLGLSTLGLQADPFSGSAIILNDVTPVAQDAKEMSFVDLVRTFLPRQAETMNKSVVVPIEPVEIPVVIIPQENIIVPSDSSGVLLENNAAQAVQGVWNLTIEQWHYIGAGCVLGVAVVGGIVYVLYKTGKLKAFTDAGKNIVTLPVRLFAQS